MKNHLLLLVFILLLFHYSFSSSTMQHHQLHQPPPPPSYLGMSMEDKTRLGSTPPSCYNKCNGCHPCMAAQVPSGPVSHRSAARLRKNSATTAAAMAEFLEPSSEGSTYSNYKPLGWKCRCRNNFYNP